MTGLEIQGFGLHEYGMQTNPDKFAYDEEVPELGEEDDVKLMNRGAAGFAIPEEALRK